MLSVHRLQVTTKVHAWKCGTNGKITIIDSMNKYYWSDALINQQHSSSDIVHKYS